MTMRRAAKYAPKMIEVLQEIAMDQSQLWIVRTQAGQALLLKYRCEQANSRGQVDLSLYSEQ